MTNIKVRQNTQRIIVDPGTHDIKVINSGPIGPRGLPGPPGASGEGAVYEHVEALPNSSWLINHNLGVHPVYSVVEASTGLALEPGEIHHSLNQMELTFLTPRAGIARLRS